MGRLGTVFVDTVQEKCLEPLVKVLREETTEESGPMSMMRGLGVESGELPFVKATSRLLGALVNFLVIRPSGLNCLKDLGVLEIVVPLMEPKGKANHGPHKVSDEDPSIIATRALTLVSRLVRDAPESVPVKLEVGILQRVDRIVERECRRVGGPNNTTEDSDLEDLDLALRILTALVTKKEGTLDRLTEI